MGLLDDLKNEAERIRADGGVRQSEQARRDARYEASLRPAMLRCLDYLKELLEQIQVVQPEVSGEYRLPGHSEPFGAIQTLPRLTMDSSDNLRKLSLRMSYVATDLTFSVRPAEQAEQTRDFLLAGRHVFSDWPIRDRDGSIGGLRFALAELVIPAAIDILADVEAGCLVFHSANVDGFLVHRDVVQPEQVDSEWLDRLGRYLLGQGRSPAHFDLPAEQRAALQQALQRERSQRDRELAEADRLREQQEQEARLGVRVRRLLGSMKKRWSDESNAN